MSDFNMNQSMDSYEDDDASGHETHTTSLFGVLASIAASLLVVVIISGNLLVMTAFFRNKSLRSISNHFLVSLSCADLLLGCVIVPFYIYFFFISEGLWYNGSLFCYFFLALDVLASTASILHLCVISVDRYIAIIHPVMYPVRMTKRFATFLIASTWFVSFGLSYPLMFYGYVIAPVRENECPLPNSILFNLLTTTLIFVLPTAVMLILYRRIFLAARIHSRRLQRGRLELGRGVGGQDAMRIHRGSGSSAVHNDENRHQANLNIEYKAAKTVGIVIGAFLFCWSPLFVVFTISPWCNTCNTSRDVFTWLGFINSAVNPFIYAFTSSSFKAAFKRILRVQRGGRRRRRRTPLPQDSTMAAILTPEENIETLELGSITLAPQ